MNVRRELQGVIPALPIPFNTKNKINFEILKQEIDWVKFNTRLIKNHSL